MNDLGSDAGARTRRRTRVADRSGRARRRRDERRAPTKRWSGRSSSPAGAPATPRCTCGSRPWWSRTGLEPHGGLQFEHAAILDVCRQPISVAEVAARIGVPLGVAQILVGDLADAGLVRVHEATPNATPALLLRMIDAVRAL